MQLIQTNAQCGPVVLESSFAREHNFERELKRRIKQLAQLVPSD